MNGSLKREPFLYEKKRCFAGGMEGLLIFGVSTLPANDSIHIIIWLTKSTNYDILKVDIVNLFYNGEVRA